MRLKSVKKYTRELIRQGHYWQYAEVDTKEDKSNVKFIFSPIKWTFIIISAIVSICFLTKGLTEHFVGCIISGLALYVGFFISFIIFVFEKFYNTDFDKTNKKETDIAGLIIQKNFIKQFTSLASYSVLVSLVCIILLAIGLIYQPMSTELNLAIYWDIIRVGGCIEIFKCSLLLIYRIAIVYFLLDLILLTLYVITSMHSYMLSIYKKTTLKDDQQ